MGGRREMKWVRFLVLGVFLGLVLGCATPVEVKQALVSIDDGYAENLKLMAQYRELVENINTRHEYWSRYIRERLMLNTVLLWATNNPRPTGELPDEDHAEVVGEILGSELVALVNEIRLEGLPSRKNPDGDVIFEVGRSDINQIIYTLPRIIREVDKKVEADYKEATQIDFTAFEDYRKNVTALRQINAMIKRYVDIDITIKPEDFQEIADAIRALQ
jgi:hypothetical protein